MTDEFKGKKVLLVDDDEEILRSLEATLADLGVEIDTARDGNAGLRKAREGKPDLMVLDLSMPKRSGFLVLEGLKQGTPKADLPRVIVITGNTGSRHRIWAESLGAEAYLQKPFRMDRFLEEVTKLLS